MVTHESGMVTSRLIVFALADLIIRAREPRFARIPTWRTIFQLKTGTFRASKPPTEAKFPDFTWPLT